MNSIRIGLSKIKNGIEKLLSKIIETSDKSGPVRDVYDSSISKNIKAYQSINEILEGSEKIWLGADWHLWKKGNLVNKFKDRIIYNQIRMVGHNDAFIFLGDLQHRNSTQDNLKSKIKNVVSRLSGKKIMVFGNHDIFDDQFYLDAGFDHVTDGFIWRDFVFTHVPIHHMNFSGAKLNIHGHVHEFKHHGLLPGKHIKVFTESNNFEPMLLSELIKMEPT